MSEQASSKTSQRLYSTRQVGWATLLGTPVAGGVLIARNERSFGRPSRAWKAIVLTGMFSLLMMTIAFLVPDRFPNWPIPLVYTVLVYQFAESTQSRLVNERRQRGAALYSNWRVAGIGFTCLVGMVAVLFGYLAVAPDSLLHRVRFQGDNEISYEDGATADEAQKLGQFFVDDGIFDAAGIVAKTYTLRHSPTGYVLDVSINDASLDDPAVADAFRTIAKKISSDVFSGKPVEVRYCDSFGTSRVRKTLTP
jgi:hypothetical protein